MATERIKFICEIDVDTEIVEKEYIAQTIYSFIQELCEKAECKNVDLEIKE
jgi:hypothetical protein